MTFFLKCILSGHPFCFVHITGHNTLPYTFLQSETKYKNQKDIRKTSERDGHQINLKISETSASYSGVYLTIWERHNRRLTFPYVVPASCRVTLQIEKVQRFISSFSALSLCCLPIMWPTGGPHHCWPEVTVLSDSCINSIQLNIHVYNHWLILYSSDLQMHNLCSIFEFG